MHQHWALMVAHVGCCYDCYSLIQYIVQNMKCAEGGGKSLVIWYSSSARSFGKMTLGRYLPMLLTLPCAIIKYNYLCYNNAKRSGPHFAGHCKNHALVLFVCYRYQLAPCLALAVVSRSPFLCWHRSGHPLGLWYLVGFASGLKLSCSIVYYQTSCHFLGSVLQIFPFFLNIVRLQN